MIYFSSALTATGLCNVARHLFEGAPHRQKEAARIFSLLSLENLSTDAKLYAAEVLLTQGDEEAARAIIENFESSSCLGPDTDRSPSLLPRLLRVLMPLNLVDEADRLLNVVPALLHSRPEITSGFIKIVNDLLLQGRKDEALRLIGKIEWQSLDSPEQLCELGMIHNRIGFFEVAAQIFASAYDKDFYHPNLHTHRAISHIFLKQFDQAQRCIDQDIGEHGRSFPNLYWQARLYSFKGNRVAATEIISEILKDHALSTASHCLALIEMANNYRALDKKQESLSCYRLASNHATGTIFPMIAQFEYALTFLYFGEYEKAQEISFTGPEKCSSNYQSRYNPCTVLHQFICTLQDRNAKHNLKNMVTYAHLWPLAYFPYHIWVLLLTAMIYNNHSPSKRGYPPDSLFEIPSLSSTTTDILKQDQGIDVLKQISESFFPDYYRGIIEKMDAIHEKRAKSKNPEI